MIIINLGKWLNSSIWPIDCVQTQRIKVDLGVMAIKGHSTHLKAPGLTIRCSLVSYIGQYILKHIRDILNIYLRYI